MKKAKTIGRITSRREFLRTCGMLGLGLAAAGAVPAVAQAAARLGGAGSAATLTRPLMGTLVSITAAHESQALREEALGRAFAEMERLIAVFDRHQGATAVSVLNRDGRLAGAPAELVAVMDRALSLHSLSEGAFDPTVAPVVDAFRLRAADGRSLDLSRAELGELLALVDARQVRVAGNRIDLGRQGMSVTLDGIAKGYIVDRASAVLTGLGVRNHLINAGGDIRACGGKGLDEPWTVAVEDPAKQGAYPGVITLRDGAVATSGSYESYFDRSRAHHHVVAPGSGVSPHAAVSVSVKAPTVMEADALATAVMVMGPRQGLAFVDSLAGRECLIVTASGAQLPSRNWG